MTTKGVRNDPTTNLRRPNTVMAIVHARHKSYDMMAVSYKEPFREPDIDPDTALVVTLGHQESNDMTIVAKLYIIPPWLKRSSSQNTHFRPLSCPSWPLIFYRSRNTAEGLEQWSQIRETQTREYAKAKQRVKKNIPAVCKKIISKMK